jgi:APA family basic amino acid/polyamine antiporter
MSHSSEADSQAPRGQLMRILGVGFGLAVIVGNTIGAGILRTPGEIAAALPNVWLFLSVWVLGAVFALLGANSVAELGTMIPESGGQFVFARKALGDYAGFIVGWSDWLSTSGTTAAVALVIGEYSGDLFTPLHGRDVWIAAGVAVFFGMLQWRGAVLSSRTQNLTSLAKALAYAIVVLAAFLWGTRQPLSGAAPGMEHSLFLSLVLALQAVIYTYDGWTGVIYFSEEVREPARDVPRALFGGVLSVMAIYLLFNLALLYVLPIENMAGDRFPAGTAAQAIFGPRGDVVLKALMVIAMLSGINAYHMMASRVFFALGRSGLLTPRAAQVNAGGTPTVALFASVTVAVLFILFGQQFGPVIEALAFFFVANYTLSFLSVFVLRRREPNAPRPYRAWGHPWTTAIAFLGSIAFLVGAVISDVTSGKKTSLYAVLLLAASYPIYRISRYLSSQSTEN